MAAALTYQEKVRTYLRVAYLLGAITVVEVGLTFVPHSEQPMKTIITFLIVALSCSKAFFVGYYYMHLNHEKKWTRIVAASPIVILLYVAALLAEIPHRKPIPEYVGEPARGVVYPTKESLELQKAEQARKASESSAAAGSEDEEDGWE